jgi:hypothetical protein
LMTPSNGMASSWMRFECVMKPHCCESIDARRFGVPGPEARANSYAAS